MPAKIIFTLMLIILPLSVFADIIITIDDMVLNGKIIEENSKTVKFGNYHGVFIIDLDKIKEIYRTGSYEEDVKILSGKGRTVNRDDIKTNYDSGLKKISEHKVTVEEDKQPSRINISISPCILFNFGEAGEVLPCSFGVSLTADIPVNEFNYAKIIHLSDITAEAGYFYSDKDGRNVTGYRASAGPQWRLPLINGPLELEYVVSAAFGAGWYDVTGLTEEAAALKWNACINTGVVFTLSAITVSPRLKFDYIYDTKAPLYGIGAVLSLGYRF